MQLKLGIFVVIFLQPVILFSQVATIDVGNVKQYIDGFGASSAWHGKLSATEADVSFKNENSNHLGLTILRVRIDPTKAWNDEKINAQLAKNRGAKVLASPWTPPDTMKTNGSLLHGSLKTTSYYSYAMYLRSFYYFCQDAMYNKLIDVISLQNEPDWDPANYEGCLWTSTQFLNFVKYNSSVIPCPIMITESLNFNQNLSDPVLNDSVAASKITYIGGHLYGTTPKNYANAISKGKRLWMTEHYFDGDTVDVCLNMGKEILDCMYYNMSAYIYWWLREPSANLINSSGFIYKKGYTLAQFSKYVRPGYYRVDATYQPQTNVWLVAFKGAANDVVVVVNKNTTPKVQNFTFKNDNISAAKRYVTSATKSIYDQGTIECTNNSFIDTLDAKSITTYVVTRSVTSSIEKTAEVIRVSPNPASDYIQINNEQDAWVYVFNSLGKIEISKNIKPLEKLDIQTLKSGLHLVSIISGNKKYTSKFVINR